MWNIIRRKKLNLLKFILTSSEEIKSINIQTF